MTSFLGFLTLLIVKYVAADAGIRDGITADFSVKVYHHLRSLEKDGNIFYSPFSIANALGMVELGAGSTTLEQIQRAMGYNYLQKGEEFDLLRDLSQSMKADSQQYVVKLVNSLFVEKGFQLSDKFLQMLKEYFSASVESIDFSQPSSVADHINEWVQNQTN
eukprot:g44527.t1